MMTNQPNSERGATAVIVAITIAMLLGIGALAVDVGHLYLSRSELQNAADACALRGAGVLYYDLATATYVTTPQETANPQGHNAGETNQSQKAAVEINWTSGNTGDVERGHWNLAARAFTPNDSIAAFTLWGKTTEQLDADTNFINAVRCVTRREATPVTNFLAPVLGVFLGTDFATTIVRAEAVAYVGFAGRIEPFEVDQPVAICDDTLIVDGEYRCSVGRMSNSGAGSACGSHQTAGWTDFNQEDTPCSGGTNTPGILDAICSGGNPVALDLGVAMATNGGNISPAMRDMKTCWDANNAGRTTSWPLMLPVINCPSPNVGTCEDFVGAVKVNVMWINDSNDHDIEGTPGPGFNTTSMDDWVCPTGYTKTQCWSDFVNHFSLQDPCGNPATYDANVMYFKPDCTPPEPTGHTGGQNFGIRAKYPALVR